MALMAFSDSEVYTDKTCSKTCLKNYETLKKQCDDLIVKLNQTEFTAATYKRGLATVEEQLITYRKNETRKRGHELKSPKDLDKLLGNQITDKSKKGLGYSALLPPHPLIYNRPNKLDLSYSGLDEFKEPEFKGYGTKNSEQESNVAEFVKPKNHEKPVKKSVSGCSRHMTGNIAYLSDFKEFDRGYVTYGGGTHCGRISAERRNRTLIEAARTMLADSKLPTTFWAEAVNSLGKFDGKSDEGFFVGYSLSSKAFRVYNTRTRRVEENLHIGFLENKPMIEGNGPKWLFDIDSLTQSMNYVPVAADASYFDSPTQDVDNGEPKSVADDQKQDGDGPDNENDEQDKSDDVSSPKEVNVVGQHINTVSPDVNTGSFKLNVVSPSVNIASSYNQDSLKDMFTMGVSHTLEATHVEFFSDEDEPEVDLGNITNSYTVLTTPNTRIHKDHLIENVIGDVKSSVQTRRMTKPTSEQGFLDAVYEQKTHDTLNTCLYACFLSQIEPTSIAKPLSDSSWVEAMQEEFLQFKLQRVWILVDMPIVKRAIGTKWERLMYSNQPPGFKDPNHQHPEPTHHTLKENLHTSNTQGLQVQQKEDGIFISQEKYVAEILKKFNYTDVKSALTLVDLEKPLVKDGDADDVDVHLYRSMIGSRCLWYSRDSPFELVAYTDSDYAGATQDRKSTTRGCQFLGNRGMSKEVGTPRYLSLVVPLKKVGDEAVHKELGDRMERAATTASSLEAEQDSGSGPRCQDTILGDVDAQTRFETTSKQSNDPPLSRGYTLGSGEDSMKLLELMELCTKLSKMLHKNRKSDLIRYALTVNPIIYTSCIQQFWATAKANTVNGERQLQALIDKKKVIITESSIRSDLHLEDAGVFINQQLGDMSHHKKIYVNPSHTKKIFANMKREGKDFSGRITPLFATMMVQPTQDEGVDSGIPTDSHQTPITNLRRNSPGGNRGRTLQLTKKETQQDEKKAKEIADLKKRVQKLERKKKSRTTGFKRLRKVGESRRVESSEDKDIVKTNQSAKEREVDTSVEDSAAPTTIKEITLAQTLIQIKAAKPKAVTTVATTTTTTRPKARRVVVQEPMEAKLIEKKALQGKRKKKPTRFDDHGNNNTSNHGAEFEKKHFAMLRAEEKRRKPPTKAQKRNLMSTYLKNMGGYKHNQLKNKSYEEIHMDVVKIKKEIEESSKGTKDELKSNKSKKAESSEEKAKGNRKKMLGKKRAGKEQQQESSKRQRMKDDKEQGEAWKKVDEVG
ncbi:putative ribonuclease H-like domain-containing protein [Tanacetum coccineum]